MPAKNLDSYGRRRSKTIAFRMSPEEVRLLDQLVAVSGMTKQDYIISKLSDTTMKVVPSSRMQKGLEEGMLLICRELLRITNGCEVSPELATLTEKVDAIFADLSEGEIAERLPSDENAIIDLERGL
ncbi:plasmid mobilization protein [Ellagibacter isourolithinifaciens]|uniref:plasmid mobilization protein n=1 Tax=Ellagibacter isourolithinifaciens TaxID=2137581 RepID=UPI003A8CC0F6